MKKPLIALIFLLFMGSVAWAQEQFVTVAKDDASPLKGPLLFMIAKQHNEVYFSANYSPTITTIKIENGKLDSLKHNPEEDYAYYIVPFSEGPVIVKNLVETEENGKQILKEVKSQFEAILLPDVEVRLLKNDFAKNKTLHYGLFNLKTGNKLSKRYHVGRYFDVKIFDDKRELVDIAPMQSSTCISFALYPELTKAEMGHTIKFTLSLRDSKTGILFHLAEVEQVL